MSRRRPRGLEHARDEARTGAAISLIYRHGSTVLGRALAHTGMGAGQHACFLLIAERDGIRGEELAQTLALDKAHVARAVARLVELGYVSRAADPSDRRAHTLRLTELGVSVVADVARALRVWNDEILAPLSATERERLGLLLDRVTAGIREDG